MVIHCGRQCFIIFFSFLLFFVLLLFRFRRLYTPPIIIHSCARTTHTYLLRVYGSIEQIRHFVDVDIVFISISVIIPHAFLDLKRADFQTKFVAFSLNGFHF